ncbi:hypothetical protein H2O64_21665 [Kordia sp. YSTF-M3]|uniref:Uncharacterized protein n=1 Tax=Kordia aestuariivivens TaxID=2759037 RepID=A0ABR7QFL9_9FLAO|nr:hypothetical protein [Kordia aestuariivivens]MBC8757293.1 hypothetical protein [Kordia aestuariivivens]
MRVQLYKVMVLLVLVISASVSFNCESNANKKMPSDAIPVNCDDKLFLSDTVYYTKAYCRALEKARGAIEVNISHDDNYYISRIFPYKYFGDSGRYNDNYTESLFFLREDKETGLHDISVYQFYESFGFETFKGEDPKIFFSLTRKYFYYDPFVEELFDIQMKDSINFKLYKDLILCTKEGIKRRYPNSTLLKKDQQTLKGYKGNIPHQEFLQYTEYMPNDSLTNNKAIGERFIIDYTLTDFQRKQYGRTFEDGVSHWDYNNVEDFNEKQISVFYSVGLFNRVEYYKEFIRHDSLKVRKDNIRTKN